MPDSEQVFVKKDNSNVGPLRELRRVFGGETVRVGDSLNAKNPEDLFDLQGGLEIDDFSMRGTGFSGTGADQIAEFDVTLTIKGTGAKKGKNASSGDAPFSTSALSFTLAGKLRANVSSARIIDFDFEGPAVVSGGKEAKGKDRHGSEVSGKKGPGGGQSRSMAINATDTATLKANFVY